MAAPSPNAATKTKKITVNEPAVIDGNTAADNHRDQDSEPKEDNAFETVSLPENCLRNCQAGAGGAVERTC